MATYDGKRDVPSANPTAASVFVLRGRADFKKHPCAANDGIEILKIPAGTILLGGAYKIVTAEGGTLTGDVGISNGGTEFSGADDYNTAGNWIKFDTAPLFNSDTFYECTAERTIYVQANNAADNAVVDFQFYAVLTTDSIAGK